MLKKTVISFFLLYQFINLATSFTISPNETTRFPVILIPGDGGSQLVAKLNKSSGPHIFCEKHTSTYTSIWLNLEMLVPELVDCFVDNMKLLYDREKHITYSPGIDIRTTDFGDTKTVEWLDPSPWTHISSAVSYFYPIVKALVDNGYVRNVSVRGAPFDFRRAPNELGDFYVKFKALIEETYNINNKTKVVLVGHSMGNPVTLYFLNHVDKAWKDQYIHSFVTVAGVWGGAVKTLRLMTSGDSLGVVLVNPLKVRPEQRAMPSTAFLMPTDRFWKPDEVLVQTAKKNYTVNMYKELFEDIKYMDGYYLRKDTEGLVYDVTAPDVPVHCLHGSNLNTPGKLIFPEGTFPDTYPQVVYDDGDGTVNMRSLLGCLRWKTAQKDPVYHVVLPNAEHMAILSEQAVINYIVKVAMPSKRSVWKVRPSS